MLVSYNNLLFVVVVNTLACTSVLVVRVLLIIAYWCAVRLIDWLGISSQTLHCRQGFMAKHSGISEFINVDREDWISYSE